MYVSRATWIFSYFVLQKMSYNTSHYKPNQIQYMDPNLLLALVQYLNIPPPHGSHCWHWCSISIYLHLMVPITQHSKLCPSAHYELPQQIIQNYPRCSNLDAAFQVVENV